MNENYIHIHTPEEDFDRVTEEIIMKLLALSDQEVIGENNYAGLREQITSISNLLVDTEHKDRVDKLKIANYKILRIGTGYDISGPQFEAFRRALGQITNDLNYGEITKI